VFVHGRPKEKNDRTGSKGGEIAPCPGYEGKGFGSRAGTKTKKEDLEGRGTTHIEGRR